MNFVGMVGRSRGARFGALLAFFLVGSLVFAPLVKAEEIAQNSTDPGQTPVKPKKVKKKMIGGPEGAEAGAGREDIDQEITNAKLRAATGSKRLWSVQSSITYNGGSIKEPFGDIRPQLSPGTIENDPTKLFGQISIKYRMTDHDNLNLGFGFGWLTPTFQGQKGQAEDPYFAYGRVFKAAGLQNVFNADIQKYTAESSVAHMLNYESDIDHTILYAFGKTGLQIAADFGWAHEFYTGQYYSPTTGLPLDQTQDSLFIYPFLEYEFNDRFSFRTVYRGITYYNTVAAQTTFVRDVPTQSMGVGIVITRDIYLYPNIQWVWLDVTSDKTNVALSANINL